MEFSSFFHEFPELVDSEFRNIFILENSDHKYIPPGNYAFLELFCSEIDCDCRKAMINIVSVNPTKVWATLNYGWEAEEYYKKWWGKDSMLYQPMSGISLDFPTNDPLKKEFLSVFIDIIKFDAHYAKRIETHYDMFKEKLQEKKRAKIEMKNRYLNKFGEKLGRNDLCSCNSGKKFKKCCFLKNIN